MSNWKKLIVSGSTAKLRQLSVDNSVTATSFIGNGSLLTGIQSGIFSTTGSYRTTTNNIQVTGSLDVDGMIKENKYSIYKVIENLVVDSDSFLNFNHITDINEEAIIVE